MIEKRAAQRYRVFKGGTITFENCGITCTVRNMSADGAAIDLDALAEMPPRLAQREAHRPRFRTVVHTV
jgi:hypothetical protein